VIGIPTVIIVAKNKPAMRAWLSGLFNKSSYMPVPEPLAPVPLDASPEVPVPELPPLVLPEPDDPEPEFDPELLPPDAPLLELPSFVPFLFVLDVPLRILSSLAFASVGVVVVLLLPPGVADVLSPRLVAPPIATGTPRQSIIAIDDTAFSAFVKGRRVKVSKFSIFKISKVVNGLSILKLTR
jgi:hypothetical protein